MSQGEAARQPKPARGHRGDTRSCQRLRARLVGYCVGIVRDERVAEDIAQEAIARALAAGIGLGRRAEPWLVTVARRLCIDHLRKMRAIARLAPVSDVEDHAASEALEQIDDVIDLATSKVALSRAFGDLRERERRVLWLHDVEGWEYTEIAELEGTTEIASRCSAYRARRTLRTKLAAAVARTLGTGAALQLWRRVRAPSVEHVRFVSPRRIAFGGTAVTLVLGSLVLTQPRPFVPAESSRTTWSLDAGTSSHLVALSPRDSSSVFERDGTTDGAGRSDDDRMIVVDAKTRHRRQGALVPKKTRLVIEVRDPHGHTLYRDETDWQCDHEGESLHGDNEQDIIAIGC